MTQVKFLIDKDFDENNAETFVENHVFAFFPKEQYNNDKDMFTCYAHIGQHSACHIEYANEGKEAQFNEYSDLLRELIGQGYKDLVITNGQEFNCHRPPTKGEIKFGEGATHYRSFTISEIGITKKGDIKKWFVSNDGLRYYTN